VVVRVRVDFMMRATWPSWFVGADQVSVHQVPCVTW